MSGQREKLRRAKSTFTLGSDSDNGAPQPPEVLAPPPSPVDDEPEVFLADLAAADPGGGPCTAMVSLPRGDDDVLSHLLVISRIHPGEKLSVSPLSVCSGGVLNMPARWWHGEGRDRTLEYLQALLDLSVERVEMLKKAAPAAAPASEVQRGYAKQFTMRIAGAMNGLSALTTTYSSDPLTVSRLETMRQGIEIRMRAISNASPGAADGKSAAIHPEMGEIEDRSSKKEA